MVRCVVGRCRKKKWCLTRVVWWKVRVVNVTMKVVRIVEVVKVRRKTKVRVAGGGVKEAERNACKAA